MATQLGLFGEAKVEVRQPEPRTRVQVGTKIAQVPLRKKRREALQRLMEVLSQLEGKDVYISTYDVAQSSDVSISLLPLRLARQPYLCQKLQSALYNGNVDVLILTTRLPIDILSAYMIFAGFDSLQNHRFSPSHTTLMSAVNIDGVAGYIARFLRG
jgi:hypothetical protein